MTNWSHEIDVIMWVVLGTFIVVLLVLAILLSRGGRSAEASATIREVRKVGKQVENMRGQNTAEHLPMQDYVTWTYGQVRRILERLGFLEDKNIPEPPLPPTAKPRNDTDTH